MAIITLQRRVTEVGRIRLGTSRPGKKGGKVPLKLERFMFTSRDGAALAQLAQQYGGAVEDWPQAPRLDIRMVMSEAAELDVLIPPRSVSQWFEAWDGGRCMRRCDGEREHLTNQACLCVDGDRLCKPTTRIAVVLADTPGLGVWRLESHGWNAAAELAGMAEWVSGQLERNGRMIPAVLRAETRSQVTRDGQPASFVVPVISSRVTPRDLIEAPAGQVMLPPAPVVRVAIEAPRRVVVVDEGPAGSGEPTSAVELAAWVERCDDLDTLNGVGARHARANGWMGEFVPSRFAPDPDTWIELVDVFRGRAAELHNREGGTP